VLYTNVRSLTRGTKREELQILIERKSIDILGITETWGRPDIGDSDDHLRLIGQRIVNFLLVLIELFMLGVTDEELRENIGSKSAISFQRGPVDPKFQVDRVPPTNHSSSQKTRLNALSYGIEIWIDLSSVLSQCTHLTDGRTDGQTEFSSLIASAFNEAR